MCDSKSQPLVRSLQYHMVSLNRQKSSTARALKVAQVYQLPVKVYSLVLQLSACRLAGDVILVVYSDVCFFGILLRWRRVSHGVETMLSAQPLSNFHHHYGPPVDGYGQKAPQSTPGNRGCGITTACYVVIIHGFRLTAAGDFLADPKKFARLAWSCMVCAWVLVRTRSP
jgi:hypothetical protein